MKMPIPGVVNLEYCRFSICWPNTTEWRGILAGLVTTPMRGRFWDDQTGNIKDVQLVGQEILEANMPLRRCILACDDNLVDVFGEIAEAMRLQAEVQEACCASDPATSGGSAGSGSEDGEGWSGDTGEPPGEPPEGWASWDDYLEYKCNVATWIYNDINADLERVSYFDILAMAALGAVVGFAPLLAGVLATPIPFDDIVVIATLLITVFGIAEGAVGELRMALQAARDGMICAMMIATNLAEAKLGTSVSWNGEIDEETESEAAAAILKLIAYKFLSSDNLNKLFELDETTDYPGQECDCDECLLEILFGSGVPAIGTPFTITSELFSGNGRYYCSLAYTCPECTDLNFEVLDIRLTGNPDPQGGTLDSCPDEAEWHYLDGWSGLETYDGPGQKMNPSTFGEWEIDLLLTVEE